MSYSTAVSLLDEMTRTKQGDSPKLINVLKDYFSTLPTPDDLSPTPLNFSANLLRSFRRCIVQSPLQSALQFTQLWSHLKQWSMTFFSLILARHESYPPEMGPTVRELFTVIEQYMVTLKYPVYTEAQFVASVADVWVKLHADFMGGTDSLERSTMRVLHQFLEFPTRTASKAAFCQALDKTPEETIVRCFERVRGHLVFPGDVYTYPGLITTGALTFVTCAVTHSTKFRRRFLGLGITPVTCGFFEEMTFHRERVGRSLYHQYMMMVLSSLESNLAADPTRLPEALDSRLMQLFIVRPADSLEEFKQGNNMFGLRTMGLIENLTMNLVHRSVLRRVYAFLRAVDGSKKESYIMNAMRDGKYELRDAWCRLKETAVRLYNFKCEYALTLSRPQCGNSKCDSIKKARKKCSGCLLEVYCSSSCQRKAWPAHRAACLSALDRRQKGEPEALPAKDNDFITAFVQEEINNNSRYITDSRVKLLRDNPLTKPEHIVVTFDHSQTPRLLEVVVWPNESGSVEDRLKFWLVRWRIPWSDPKYTMHEALIEPPLKLV